MACGLPVISTEFHAGVHDIVKHNINGLVVPIEEVESLGDAIKFLMDDAALRSRLGNAGVEVAKNYSLDIVSNRWDTVLNEVLL
jgi:glycosyltransferase involved in cell wall biosynthesis